MDKFHENILDICDSFIFSADDELITQIVESLKVLADDDSELDEFGYHNTSWWVFESDFGRRDDLYFTLDHRKVDASTPEKYLDFLNILKERK